jgi:uncharacterized protein
MRVAAPCFDAMRDSEDEQATRRVPFATPGGAGLRLAVRLTPRAARNGVDGIGTGADGRPALRLRAAAPPVEGAANGALVAFLAEALRLRKADIAIVSGERGRSKLLELAGDPADLLDRLAAWIEARGRRRP